MRRILHILWMALLILCACAPSPKVLREDLRQVRSVADQVAGEHKQLCTPHDSPAGVAPAPPPGEPPARCTPLTACLDSTGDAASHCRQAIDLAGRSGYRRGALLCEDRQAAALQSCADLGYRPKAAPVSPEVPHGTR